MFDRGFMNHDILKAIIFEQHEIIKNEEILERNFEFDENANYALVGLRRAGKSTILHNVAKKLTENGTDWNRIIFINFEDERLSEFSVSDFNDIVIVASELSDEKPYFFLDEIQNIKGWEKFARRLADSKEKVFITGSNAKMLSSEIETTLGGRFLTKFVTPYNFCEFLRAKKVDFDEKSFFISKSSGKILRAFDEYLNNGGFPESLNLKNKREYVSNIYQKILLGDIAVRNSVRNSNALKIMMKKIAESVKDEISFTKLHNILKTIGVSISKDSVIDYIDFSQKAFLFFPVRNYYSKFIDKESNPKYYFLDNGILNLFLNDKNSVLLENLVAIYLFENFEEIYYLKSEKTGIDIDFFIPDTKTAIQVAYSIENISNNREIQNFIRLSKSEKIENFLILTYNEEKTFAVDDIKINAIPVWKYSLSTKYQ